MPQRYAPPKRRRRRGRSHISPLLIFLIILVLALLAAGTILLTRTDLFSHRPPVTDVGTDPTTDPLPPDTERPETEAPETEAPETAMLAGEITPLYFGMGSGGDYQEDRLIYAVPDMDATDLVANGTFVTAGQTLFVQNLHDLSDTAAEAEQKLMAAEVTYREAEQSRLAAKDKVDELTLRRSELFALSGAMSVKAPAEGGTVLNASLWPGQQVQKDQLLCTVLTTDTLSVTQYFSYAHAATVFVGMKAYVSTELDGEVILMDATVSAISFREHTDEDGVPCFAVTMDVFPGQLLSMTPESLPVTAYFQNERGIKVYPMIPGSLHFRDAMALTAPADGFITEVKVFAGSQVEGETLLCTLENPAIDGELRQIEEQIPTAVTALSTAEQQYAAAAQEFDSAQKTLESIRAAIESDRRFGVASHDGVLIHLAAMDAVENGVLAGDAIDPLQPLMLICRSDSATLLFTFGSDEEDNAPVTEAITEAATDTSDKPDAPAEPSVTDTSIDPLLPDLQSRAILRCTAFDGSVREVEATVQLRFGHNLILTVPTESAAVFAGGIEEFAMTWLLP